MNFKFLAAFWLVFSCHSYGGGIPHSEEALGKISSEFTELVDLLHKQRDTGLPTDEQLVRASKDVESGPSSHLLWRGREFSYQPVEDHDFIIKVYGVERTYSVFSVFDCANWIEYSSSNGSQSHKVVHKVGGWVLIEACRP